MWCSECRAGSWSDLAGLALHLPEGRRFWKENARIRTLPEREVEVDGVPGLVVGLRSAARGTGLDVAFARDTYGVLHVEPTGGG